MNPSQMRHPAFVRKLLRAMREAQRTRWPSLVHNRKGDVVLEVRYDRTSGTFTVFDQNRYNLNYPVRAVIVKVMSYPTWVRLVERIPRPSYGEARWCQPDGKRVG